MVGVQKELRNRLQEPKRHLKSSKWEETGKKGGETAGEKGDVHEGVEDRGIAVCRSHRGTHVEAIKRPELREIRAEVRK